MPFPSQPSRRNTPGRRWHPLDADRHIAAKLLERRLLLGLTQQQLAELIGVTYQQTHKYEKGVNRISVGRLHRIATALGVEVSHFYDGIGAEPVALEHSSKQRLLLQLLRNFVEITSREHQEAVCRLARVLASSEPDDEGSE